MSYLDVENFHGGLDARKYKLALPAGTLTSFVNGHITQGSEIEKRKLFLPYQLPGSTFGAQETTTGIVVFGSRPAAYNLTLYSATTNVVSLTLTPVSGSPIGVEFGDSITITNASNALLNGTWTISAFSLGLPTITVPGFGSSAPTGATGNVALNFPPPMIFQQLLHPLGANMTGVVSSTYFADRTQVITTWDNGDTLVFDGASLEKDWYVGSQSNITPTPFAIANSLVAQAVATGKYTGINPVLASLYFQVTGGTAAGGNQVTSVTYNFNRAVTLTVSGNPVTATSFSLLASPQAWATSNNATAAALATAMNTVDGFTVVNGSTNFVTITPPATDYYGATLGVNPADTITVVVGGNVTVFVVPYAAVFDLLSVPSVVSANPYNVNTNVVDAAIPYRLVSSGVAAAVPVSASGQFTITNGGQNAQGTGTLTISALPANNDTVTIGASVYTFVNALTGAANQILIGATIDATLGNLVSAINGTGGSGSIYSGSTSPSTVVLAGPVTAHATLITAQAGGTPGNIAVSKSSAALVWSGLSGGATGTLTGGTDTNQISQITVAGVNLLLAEVPFNTSVNQTANDVVAGINAFQGTSGFSATNNNGIVTITATDGTAALNGALVSVTTAGNVCIASCTFFVTGSAGLTCTSITANGTTITNGTVTWATSNAVFAAAIAASIITKGLYGALAVGNQIWISPLTSNSTDGVIVIVCNGTATFTQTPTGGALVATANTSTIFFQKVIGTTRPFSVNHPNSAVVTVTGGNPPYSYKWTYLSGSTAFLAQAGLTGANQWWQGPPLTSTTFQAQWLCTVTDSSGTVQTQTVLFDLVDNLTGS